MTAEGGKRRSNSQNPDIDKDFKDIPLNLTEWFFDFLNTRYGVRAVANKKF